MVFIADFLLFMTVMFSHYEQVHGWLYCEHVFMYKYSVLAVSFIEIEMLIYVKLTLYTGKERTIANRGEMDMPSEN